MIGGSREVLNCALTHFQTRSQKAGGVTHKMFVCDPNQSTSTTPLRTKLSFDSSGPTFQQPKKPRNVMGDRKRPSNNVPMFSSNNFLPPRPRRRCVAFLSCTRVQSFRRCSSATARRRRPISSISAQPVDQKTVAPEDRNNRCPAIIALVRRCATGTITDCIDLVGACRLLTAHTISL